MESEVNPIRFLLRNWLGSNEHSESQPISNVASTRRAMASSKNVNIIPTLVTLLVFEGKVCCFSGPKKLFCTQILHSNSSGQVTLHHDHCTLGKISFN